MTVLQACLAANGQAQCTKGRIQGQATLQSKQNQSITAQKYDDVTDIVDNVMQKSKMLSMKYI
eukprot:1281979-Amphidinium_carterae.2